MAAAFLGMQSPDTPPECALSTTLCRQTFDKEAGISCLCRMATPPIASQATPPSSTWARSQLACLGHTHIHYIFELGQTSTKTRNTIC